MKCSDGTLSCSYAVYLAARVKAHNDGKGAKFTKAELSIIPQDAALEKFTHLSTLTLKKFNLGICQEKSFKSFAKKYGWKAFECLHAAYKDLPGFVPFEKDVY